MTIDPAQTRNPARSIEGTSFLMDHNHDTITPAHFDKAIRGSNAQTTLTPVPFWPS